MNNVASNMTFRNYDEKRDFIRMKMDTEVTLALDETQNVTGFCRDLSGTGMLIEVGQEVNEANLILKAAKLEQDQLMEELNLTHTKERDEVDGRIRYSHLTTTTLGSNARQSPR